MKARDFRAEEGQPIAPLLYRFARLVIGEARVRIQGPARVHKTADGKKVVYEPEPQTFPGSFLHRLTGPREIAIGEGLVSGLVPTVDGVRLDGLDDDGEPLPAGPPRLPCSPPLTGSRSWVVLITTASTDTGEIVEEAEAPVRLEHRLELPRGMWEESKNEIWRIVAAVAWRGEGEAARIERVRQVVWYDQEVYRTGSRPRYRAAS